MYFISDKYVYVVGGVGSYFQLAVIYFILLFWSHLTKPDNVVSQSSFDPPFHKSGSAPHHMKLQEVINSL